MDYSFFHDEALCTDAVVTRPARAAGAPGKAGSAGDATGHAADFRQFAEAALAPRNERPARHQLMLIDALQEITAGSIDRLMVQMPPGAAKSTYGSVLFPAYWFSVRPGSEVIAACHTASLAEFFGRRVRQLIADQGESFGVALDPSSRSAARFGLGCGGQYFATGVRGPITGRRADLILIDDPVKSWAEADAPGARDSLYNWYRAELLSRLKPGGRVVMIMTRWHEDDLAGRLLRDDPDWTLLRLPALAEPGDPLGRRVGEALWPEWESEAALQRKRSSMGERMFKALYQQDPTSDRNLTFKLAGLVPVPVAPVVVRTVRAWDLAATVAAPGRDPDWTVGLKLGMTADGHFVVLDVVRVRAGPADVERLLIDTAKSDGVATLVALAQDPGQAGVAQVAFLRRSLAGYHVESSPETGAKQTRAMPASALIGAGRLDVLEAPWTRVFLDELSAFPNGDKDDQVDALSRAVATIEVVPAASRVVRHFLMGR